MTGALFALQRCLVYSIHHFYYWEVLLKFSISSNSLQLYSLLLLFSWFSLVCYFIQFVSLMFSGISATKELFVHRKILDSFDCILSNIISQQSQTRCADFIFLLQICMRIPPQGSTHGVTKSVSTTKFSRLSNGTINRFGKFRWTTLIRVWIVEVRNTMRRRIYSGTVWPLHGVSKWKIHFKQRINNY